MVSVLVVDDSKFMAKALGRLLESEGFRVVAIAHDGVEGLAAFKQHEPDVTLLDITMPNMDGVECLAKILEFKSDASVIMLSAIQDPEIVERCTSAGAAAYLKKPIRGNDPDDIQRLVNAISCAVGSSAEAS